MNLSKSILSVKKRIRTLRNSREMNDRLFAIALIIPAFAILGVVIFAPIIKGIWMSFFDYTLMNINAPKWNNLENYKSLFQNGEIFLYFFNTITYVFFTVSIQFVLAMVVALMLNTKIKGRNLFRGLFLISWTIPSVVVALLWSWLLQPQYGVLNYILHSLGLIQNMNTLWVQSPNLAMSSVIVAVIWKQCPYMIVMILAGLQSISKDYMEAASIDGANKFQVFRHVMIPSIRPVIDTTILIAVMNNFQMFTIIYNMTAGGPMSKTTTLSIAAYSKAFTEYDLGAGSAIGVMWLIVLATITFFYNKYSEKNRLNYM